MLHTPEFLTLGHVTRDLHADGSSSPGGTVTFAALTAYRLGLVSAIVTCADAHFAAELPAHLPNIELQVHSSAATTTFTNQYQNGFRTQYLHSRAASLKIEDIPLEWQSAPVVLLGPVAQEIPPAVLRLFTRRSGALVAATPQGWLRRWDSDGRVWPEPWKEAEKLLPLLDVLILSHDDLLPFAQHKRENAERTLEKWSQYVPLLVATDGQHGAVLYKHGAPSYFPAYPTQEIDPTGAGDVFAAAFLFSLYRESDPARAVDFANCVASLSIEQSGILGIPTLEMVQQRLRS